MQERRIKIKMKIKKKEKPKEKRMKYSSENLKKALDAVYSGMSKKHAAKQFQVPRSTIQFRLNNPDKTNPRPGPSTVLTAEEENSLVNWIVQSSKKGFPRRKEDIQHSVSDFLKKAKRPNPFKNDLPGDKWLKLFLKRHPEIAIRTPESVTAASSVVSENDIRSWFNGIEKYLRDNDFFDILSDPSRVFNGDETNFLLCPKTGVVLALKGDKNVYEIDRGQAKSAITVMFTFCANGDLTPPMVILPYKRLPAEISSKVPKEWGIGLSDNGWMKADLFFDYIKNVLHPYLVKMNKRFPVVLFVDGHKTHLTLQVSELCSELQIILIALYPNCTRILQPADVAAFFPLKCAWKQSVLRWRRDHPAQALTKAEFMPILEAAIKGSLKPDTIKNGFRACGLQPWNPDALDYTKCLGVSQEKQTSQSQPPANDLSSQNKMTKEDFVNIVGSDTINKLTTDSMIHDASKLLQRLWFFFGDSSSSRNESEQLDINKMQVILADDLIQSNSETTITAISPQIETPISYGPDLPVMLDIPLQETVSVPNQHKIIGEIACDQDKKVASETNVVPSEPSSHQIYNIQEVVLTDNHSELHSHFNFKETSALKTPCKLNNLKTVNLNDILILPKTPKRKGTKNTEKTPFVLTSEEWQRINTEKKKAKELKEEGIKQRRLEREQRKIIQRDKKQHPGKGKGKGKGKGENIQNVKKHLFTEKFYLPDPDIQKNEKENITQNIKNTARGEINEERTSIECDDFNIYTSTSCGMVTRGFTTTDIYKMLADSDTEDSS